MTVEEFLEWCPDDGTRWQLIDGVPVGMSPPTSDHNRIAGALAMALSAHILPRRPECLVLAGSGVVPGLSAATNHRLPDLIVTCGPPNGGLSEEAPVLVVEVLSPSNARVTRQNVWAYTTIASVREILLLEGRQIAGELLRRGSDGAWPTEPLRLGDGDTVELASVGLSVPLREIYRATTLVRPRS
jgi:Uma2 family endonuclease